MLYWIYTLLSLALATSADTNPWGPDCATLDECLKHLRETPECTAPIEQCIYDQSSVGFDGLSTEFEKFGRSAVPPLLELVKTGNPSIAARAAMILDQLTTDFRQDEAELVFDAWRRNVVGADMLATRLATPEFAREVMTRLRQNPERSGHVGNTFSNFRDWDSKPSGIFAAISEHIECSKGEPCDSRFAKLQIDWLVSNRKDDPSVDRRIMEAFENPTLDSEGKIAALQMFRPSQYSRTREQLEGIAVPFLRTALSDNDAAVSVEAAQILAMFRDTTAIGKLMEIATQPSNTARSRVAALISLAGFSQLGADDAKKIETLLSDENWDVRRHAVILVGQSREQHSADVLIPMIDSRDWLVSFSAISALKDMPGDEAKQAVQRVASSYWHPVVRAKASNTLSLDPNLAQYPAGEQHAVNITRRAAETFRNPVYGMQDFEIGNWCKARFEQDGYRFVPDFITGPDVIAEANSASRFNAEHFSDSLLKLSTMKGAVKLTPMLEHESWLFVGTSGDDGTGQLTVAKKGVQQQIVLQADVAAVFLWKGRPHVITGVQNGRVSDDGFLMELSQNVSQVWTAHNLLRLTGGSEAWLAPDGTIGLLGTGGAMMIHPDGSPEWVGCPNPGFP